MLAQQIETPVIGWAYSETLRYRVVEQYNGDAMTANYATNEPLNSLGFGLARGGRLPSAFQTHLDSKLFSK